MLSTRIVIIPSPSRTPTPNPPPIRSKRTSRPRLPVLSPWSMRPIILCSRHRRLRRPSSIVLAAIIMDMRGRRPGYRPSPLVRPPSLSAPDVRRRRLPPSPRVPIRVRVRLVRRIPRRDGPPAFLARAAAYYDWRLIRLELRRHVLIRRRRRPSRSTGRRS